VLRSLSRWYADLSLILLFFKVSFDWARTPIFLFDCEFLNVLDQVLDSLSLISAQHLLSAGLPVVKNYTRFDLPSKSIVILNTGSV